MRVSVPPVLARNLNMEDRSILPEINGTKLQLYCQSATQTVHEICIECHPPLNCSHRKRIIT